MSTPLGAFRSGATGIKHGPLGMQVVPTLPIIQFAIGMQAINAARYTSPSARLVAIECLSSRSRSRSVFSLCNYAATVALDRSALYRSNPSARSWHAGQVPQPYPQG